MPNIYFCYEQSVLRCQWKVLFQENGVLPRSHVCDGCNRNLSVVRVGAKEYYYFYCSTCKKKYSLRKQTILSFASISIRKFILLVYTFISCLWTYQQVKTEVNVTSSDDDESEVDDKESKHVALLSDKTISRFYTIFR